MTQMELKLTMVAKNSHLQKTWENDLNHVLSFLPGFSVKIDDNSNVPGQLVFLDQGLKDLEDLLKSIDRRGRAIFLIVPEDGSVPEALADGRVDDVLVHPFRALEVLGKLRHYQSLLMWDEVANLNTSFGGLIEQFREDLRLAERIQKSRLPFKFPDIPGFRAKSRYLAGMKSGGDYFDLAESKQNGRFSMILTDSSSYGLSSSVLTVLVRIALKLSAELQTRPSEIVRKMFDELMVTLSEKDTLSMFYGVFSRKDLELKYLNLGSNRLFHRRCDREFVILPNQGCALAKSLPLAVGAETPLSLEPEDRLVLVSDGFVEAVGGEDRMVDLLNHYLQKDPLDILNEFVFQVKRHFKDEDDLPKQDCSAIVLDVDSNVVKLSSVR